jgi:acyl carrier protein
MDDNQNDSFVRVRNVVDRVFKVSPEPVTAQTSVGQLPGWDSFGHLRLIMEIEKEFGLRFPTDKIIEANTVEAICQLVSQLKTK